MDFSSIIENADDFSYTDPVDGSVVELSSIDSLNPLTFTWEPLYPSSLVGYGYYYIYFSTDSSDLEASIALLASAATDSLNWTDEGALQDLYLEQGFGAGDEFTLYWWVSPDYYIYSDNESSYFNGSNSLLNFLTPGAISFSLKGIVSPYTFSLFNCPFLYHSNSLSP